MSAFTNKKEKNNNNDINNDEFDGELKYYTSTFRKADGDADDICSWDKPAECPVIDCGDDIPSWLRGE
jgi:hypothetical protein